MSINEGKPSSLLLYFSIQRLWSILNFLEKNCRIIELNHRIVQLEGILKGSLVQLPCNEQVHPQLDLLAQSIVQPDSDCVQGWGFHYLSGEPVQMSHHTYCKKKFFISNLNLPYGLKSFPLVLSQTLLKSLSSSLARSDKWELILIDKNKSCL